MIKQTIVAALAAFFSLSTVSNAEIPHRAIVIAENTSVYITANLHIDSVDDDKGTVESEDVFNTPVCSGTVVGIQRC